LLRDLWWAADEFRPRAPVTSGCRAFDWETSRHGWCLRHLWSSDGPRRHHGVFARVSATGAPGAGGERTRREGSAAQWWSRRSGEPQRCTHWGLDQLESRI